MAHNHLVRDLAVGYFPSDSMSVTEFSGYLNISIAHRIDCAHPEGATLLVGRSCQALYTLY